MPFLEFKWPKQIWCLGIYLRYNKQLLILDTGTKSLMILRILNKWQNHDFLPCFQITSIENRFPFEIDLTCPTICITKDLVYKKIFHKFLWGSAYKVPRNNVIQTIEQGGLTLINTQAFVNYLIANWTNRILEADPSLHG